MAKKDDEFGSLLPQDSGINPATGQPWDWGKDHRWSSTDQPSGASKSAGWAKRRRNRQLAQYLLGMEFVGKSAAFKDKIQQYFGLESMEGITNEAIIQLTQIGKAIEQGDTAAAQALLERAYGKPKEFLDLGEDADGVVPTFVINVLPSDAAISESEHTITDKNEYNGNAPTV